MSELEKYEKLRLHIKQLVTDIEKSLDSLGMAEKLAKQMELIFLDQMLDKMKQLDDEDWLIPWELCAYKRWEAPSKNSTY